MRQAADLTARAKRPHEVSWVLVRQAAVCLDIPVLDDDVLCTADRDQIQQSLAVGWIADVVNSVGAAADILATWRPTVKAKRRVSGWTNATPRPAGPGFRNGPWLLLRFFPVRLALLVESQADAKFLFVAVLCGDMPLCRWDRVDGAFLLDVREPVELTVESAPGAVNVPPGQLRSRLGELPRDREILVVCRSAQRAYYATRILLQIGFLARNISGGMLARAIRLLADGGGLTQVHPGTLGLAKK